MKNKKISLVAGAAFAAVAMVADGASAQARPDWFQLRLDMIEALEVTHDDDRLGELVRQDAGLDQYYRVLIRAISHLDDPALAEKLLDLPVLDKRSPDYLRAVEGVFSYFAGNGIAVKPECEALLFDRFKHDRDSLNRSLGIIFSMVAEPSFPPNVETAKLLIAHGGDPEAAAQVAENMLSSHPKASIDGWLEEKRGEIRAFRQTVSGPSGQVPVPAP